MNLFEFINSIKTITVKMHIAHIIFLLFSKPSTILSYLQTMAIWQSSVVPLAGRQINFVQCSLKVK